MHIQILASFVFAEQIPASIHMFKSMCSVDVQMLSISAHTTTNADLFKTTPVGFEPTRAEPIGLAGRRLNHSAKVSSDLGHIMLRTSSLVVLRSPWLSKASALTVHRGSVVSTSLVRSASALVLFLAFNLGGSVCLIRPDSVLFHMVVVRSVAECLHLILSA